MTDSKPSDVIKKVYVKPILTEVRLVAQEAVLATCKENDGALAGCAPDLSCESLPRS